MDKVREHERTQNLRGEKPIYKNEEIGVKLLGSADATRTMQILS